MSLQSKVTKQLGGFGLYQRRLCVVLWLVAGIMATFRLVTLFVAYVPQHRCKIDELERLNHAFEVPAYPRNATFNSTIQQIQTYIPLELTSTDQYQWNQCNRYKTRNKTTSKFLIPCEDGWTYSVSSKVVTAVMEFDLVCEKSWTVPLIHTMLLIGIMFGSLSGGYLSDRYGRKTTLLLCFPLMLAGSLAVAWTPAVAGVHIGMLIVGMPSIMSLTSSVIFIRESTSPKKGKKLCLILMVVTSVGNLLTPVFAYLIPNWRWMLTVMAITAILTMPLVVFFVEESVIWLLQSNNTDRAKLVINRIAIVNGLDVQLPEISQLELWEEDVKSNTDDESVKETPSKHPEQLNFIHLFKISFLRKRLIALSISLFSISMVYYGLSLNANRLAGDIYLNCFLSALIDIPADVFGSLLVIKIGCRRVFLICVLTCGAFMLVTPLLKTVHDVGETVCAMAAKFFVGGSFIVMHLFTGDFFPTLLRNQAYGASSFFARFGGIVVPYVLYLGDVVHFSVPYLTMGASCIMSAIAVYTLPDTKDVDLPVTMEDARELDQYLPKFGCGACRKTNVKQTASVKV